MTKKPRKILIATPRLVRCQAGRRGFLSGAASVFNIQGETPRWQVLKSTSFSDDEENLRRDFEAALKSLRAQGRLPKKDDQQSSRCALANGLLSDPYLLG